MMLSFFCRNWGTIYKSALRRFYWYRHAITGLKKL